MHLTIFVDKVGDQSFTKTDPDDIAKYGNTSSVLIQFRTFPMDESQADLIALGEGKDWAGIVQIDPIFPLFEIIIAPLVIIGAIIGGIIGFRRWKRSK